MIEYKNFAYSKIWGCWSRDLIDKVSKPYMIKRAGAFNLSQDYKCLLTCSGSRVFYYMQFITNQPERSKREDTSNSDAVL